MPITQTLPPTEEPITLAEVRQQSRIDADITTEDALITGLMIPAAREYCEQHTGKRLMAQTLTYTGAFAPVLELSPLLSSVVSVKYIDAEGVQQTLDPASYYVDTASLVGSVQPLAGWPVVHSTHPQPVTIEFTAGYADAAAVPAAIKQAMVLLVDHWYSNRSAVAIGAVSNEIDFSVSALLKGHRMVML